MNHLQQIVFQYAPEYFRQAVKNGMSKETAIKEFEMALRQVLTDEDSDATLFDEVDKFTKSLTWK